MHCSRVLVLDLTRFEETKNSYLGSYFMQWLICEKRKYDKERHAWETQGRNKLSRFLPPVDAAVKIYRISDVDIVQNTFQCMFVHRREGKQHTRQKKRGCTEGQAVERLFSQVVVFFPTNQKLQPLCRLNIMLDWEDPSVFVFVLIFVSLPLPCCCS